MILSGELVANEIQQLIKERLSTSSKKRAPKLAAVLVGNNSASEIYISVKRRACAKVGIDFTLLTLSPTIKEEELLHHITTLNEDPYIDGILVQLPLPEQINSKKIIERINPNKDVDGFHPINMGKLLLGHTDGFIPCTPLGIQQLLKYANITTSGKDMVIVGRSNIVGKPLAALMMQKNNYANATVTLCHTESVSLIEHTKKADILVAACGKSHFIKAHMVKEGAIVIDVGIHRIESAQGMKLVGDVDFENVSKKAAAITPVPKGIGPMTVTMLLENTIKSYSRL